MARPRKDNHAIALKISTTIYNRLNEYCESTGVTKTGVIEKALEEYLNKYDQEQIILEKYQK